MAFSATGILIVMTTGSDANGGGFNPGNSNFATDGAVATATTTPVFSSASYTFVAGDVGARVFIKSGSNSIPGWYTIASVSAGAATLTASIGSATLFDGTNASGVSTAAGCGTAATLSSLTWGVDYSLQASPKITFTDMVASATTFTSVANPVGKNMIGNYINITSGTNYTVQRVEVVSTSTITATVDKTLGATAGAGGNGKLGGALASPGMASRAGSSAPGAWVAGNDVFLKSGTYTLTSALSNVSGGLFAPSGDGSVGNNIVIEGFQTVPKDVSMAATIGTGALTGITAIALNGANSVARNLIVDGVAGANSNTGFSSSVWTLLDRCKASNCDAGISLGAGGFAIRCEATACLSVGISLQGDSVGAFACYSHDNTGHGFGICDGASLAFCISDTNGSNGFLIAAIANNGNTNLLNCVAYGNTGSGFLRDDSTSPVLLANCIAEANGSGFASSSADASMFLLNCAAYNTGTAIGTNVLVPAIGFVTGSASFFTNAAAGNFALNSTAGAGAAARGTGFPGVLPAGTTTGHSDIGAAQHADPAVTDVRLGVATAGSTGTLALPDQTDVRNGTQYGAGGTEFTGSLSAGGGGARRLGSPVGRVR